MNQLITKEESLTMTSSQLAGLLGMEKKEVNRKIKDMFQAEIDGGKIPPSLDSRGYVVEYNLPELESTMFVGKWHNPFLRQLATFWIERKDTIAPNFNNPAVAARLWADQYEQKQLAIKKVAEAVKFNEVKAIESMRIQKLITYMFDVSAIKPNSHRMLLLRKLLSRKNGIGFNDLLVAQGFQYRAKNGYQLTKLGSKYGTNVGHDTVQPYILWESSIRKDPILTKAFKELIDLNIEE